jgi:hypothetical protein
MWPDQGYTFTLRPRVCVYAMRVRRIHARTAPRRPCVYLYVYVYSRRAHNALLAACTPEQKKRERGWPITIRYYGGVDAILPATAKLKVIENRIEISKSEINMRRSGHENLRHCQERALNGPRRRHMEIECLAHVLGKRTLRPKICGLAAQALSKLRDDKFLLQ